MKPRSLKTTGAILTEGDAALGHDYVEAGIDGTPETGTGETIYVCSRCGAYYPYEPEVLIGTIEDNVPDPLILPEPEEEAQLNGPGASVPEEVGLPGGGDDD